jgi:hypothetical protein
MATSKSFMREPKMDTTEPSVDEVKLKRGGHAKKHMAMGGNPMMAAPIKRPMMRRPMVAPAMPAGAMGQGALLRKHGGKAHKVDGGYMRGEGSISDYEAKMMEKATKKAKGGKMESKAEEMREERQIKRVEKELKHHESMKAKKAHHGLKMGGKASAARDDTPGGLLGGIEATRPNRKKDTGGIELSKYKHGGKMRKAEGGLAAKGDSFQSRSAMKPKIDVNDKVVSAAKNKKMGSSTGGVKNTVAGESDGGYKRGGHATKKHHYAKGGTVSDSVAKRYVADMKDGSKNKSAGSKTGSIELSKFKKGGHVKHEAHGGHVKHHEKSKHHHDASGHMHHKEHSMKHHEHGGHVHHKEHMKMGGSASCHTTKMSTTLKRGGKACNY